MIFETPQQSGEVLKNLYSKNYRDKPIIENFPGFEECFLAFHPFLIIKEGHAAQIHFQTGNWPSKQQIVDHCDRLSWSDFLKISGVSDYKKLDQALAFFHRAYRFGTKSEYQKLKKIVSDDSCNIILPQVDNLPEIIENEIFKFLKQKGYSGIYIYSDIEEKKILSSIGNLISEERGLQSHVRIETPDSRILIAQDFDQRLT